MNLNKIISVSFRSDLERFFKEDDLERNFYYINSLPDEIVECKIIFKSETTVAGMPFFLECFKYLGGIIDEEETLLELEGKRIFKTPFAANFTIPFSLALTGERVALNLLQNLSGIAHLTSKFVEKAQKYQISILDTRKTVPGLRSLQKYAVRIGGGCNHRMGQSDLWMIKDNHKQFFGGIKNSLEYFSSMHSFYQPIVLEIHSLNELKEAIDLKVKHVMLDNFSPDLLVEAIKIKAVDMTYEISGGITLDNIDNYLMRGVDAISVGSLTTKTLNADISLKYQRIS